MNQSNATEITRRLAALPEEKRRLFRERLAEQGIDPWRLPIVARPREAAAHYPLSLAQRRFLAAEELGGRALYNLCSVLRFHGKVDLEALNQAVRQVVDRHEILRTRFAGDANGEPCQRVEDDLLPPLEVEPVRVADGDTGAWSQAEYHRQLDQRFNLREEPPLRVRFFDTGHGEYWLFFTIHHIAFDAWSAQQLNQEVAACYQAAVEGGRVELPELPIQYRDYVLWQREWMTSQHYRDQCEHWREVLGDAPQALNLPTDRPRPASAERRFSGGNLSRPLPAELSAGIQRAVRELGTTLYIYGQTVFTWLLAKYSHDRDICLGTSIANRQREELAPLIGPLLNTLVMRHDLTGDPSFRDALVRSREVTAAAFDNPDVPFEELPALLDRDRGEGLFRVMYVQLSLPKSRQFELPGVAVEMVEPEQHQARFDLTLRLVEQGDGRLRLDLEYSDELFERATVEQMLAHLQDIFQQTLEQPGVRLSQLHWRHGVSELATAPLAQAPCPLDRRVASLARQQPDACALVAPEGRYSYRELIGAVDNLAQRMALTGMSEGDRVALCLPRTPVQVAAMLACWRLGAVVVFLDPALPAQRLADLIEDSDCALVLLAAPLDVAGGRPALRVDQWPGSADNAAPEQGVGEESRSQPGQAAYLIYTSGSTGRPKGVVVSHHSLSHYAAAVTERLQLPVGARHGTPATVAADLGLTSVAGALHQGGTLVLPDPAWAFDPPALADYLDSEPVDCLKIVPSHLKGLLAVENPRRLLPRHTLVLGGEGLDAGLVVRVRELAPELRIVNHYGPSEATVGVCSHAVETVETPVADTATPYLPLGTPLPGCRLRVLDEDLNPVPRGASGELYIEGPQLALGYWRRPHLTAGVFLPAADGSGRGYRTGDRVRINTRGELEFLGRVDDQVKIRGYRVEPGEAAQWLNLQPEVSLAAVLARDLGRGQQLVAYVQAADTAPDLARLQARMREQLPDYLVPAHWQLMEHLPLNTNGKVDRQALPDPQTGEQSAEPAEATRELTATEARLADFWRQLLGVEQVTPDDDFFQLGGDSILSLQLIALAAQAGLPLTPRQVMADGRLRAMAGEADPTNTPDAGLPPRVERSRPQPLSPAQRRLWFLQQLDPQSVAYNVPQLLAVTGRLDVAALRQSCEALVRRHESLRCRFFERDDQVWQQVADEVSPLFQVHPDRGADWQAAATRAASRAFDLEQGPLLAVDLFPVGPEEYRLLINVHHIAVDGWSMALLVRDFVAAYQASVENRPLDDAERTVDFLDLAVWQHQAVADGRTDAQLAYWRERLAGADFDLLLPLDHPRPAHQTSEGRRLEHSVPDAVTREVNGLARGLGVSPFTVYLAAYQVLLWRYSGQSDFTVGVPVAGRDDPHSQELVGLFVNTLVHRSRLRPEQALSDYLQQLGRQHQEDLAHQELPFEQLVDALAVERDLSRSPLFQVMFNYQKDHRGERRIELPGLAVEPLALERVSAKFDLTFNLFEQQDSGGDDSTTLLVEYPPVLFEEATVATLVADYVELLRSFGEGAQHRLEALPLASTGSLPEAGEVLPAAELEDFVARFDERARRHPDRIAVISGDRQLRYGELAHTANRLAHWLLAQDVAPETPVAFCLPRDERLLICLLGIQKAGLTYVPIDPTHPAERNGYILQQATPALCLCADETRQGVAGTAGRTLVWSELELQLALQPAGAPDCPPARPQQLAYTLYTSGSTGRPKGVQISRGSFANFLVAMERILPLEEVTRYLALTTITFDIAGLELCLPLVRGGTVVMADDDQRHDPQALLALIRARQVQLVQATPATWSLLLEDDGGDLAEVVALTGGEALPAELGKRLASAARQVINVYGPTETTVWSSSSPVTGAVADGVLSIGRPLLNNRCHVLDDRLNPVPVGVAGELYIAGEGLARGYADQPALTAERFLPDPFGPAGGRLYRTGDRARWLASGELQYLGRTDGQVKVRGFRVELGEIEAALQQHPSVRQAAVVVHQAALAAYWVTRDGCQVDAAGLRAHLAERLPEYMVPTWYQPMTELPLNSNGKVDRKALPQPDGGSRQDTAPAAALNGAEQYLAAIWCEVLGIDEVRADDNFFHLGGHSLKATQVRSRLRAEGVELPLKLFFEEPVLAAQARALSRVQSAAGQRAAIPRAPRDGDLPLSDAQRRVWFMQHLNPRDASFNMAFAVELRGALDPAALREALQRVSERHEILRTTYHQVGDEPVQRIHPQLPPDFATTDLPPGAVDADLERLLAAASCHPFDLEREAPLRVRLYRRGERDFVCQFIQHHIASDAWSTTVLLDEVIACYGEAGGGPAGEMPPLTIQYADYAAWQVSDERREQHRQGLEFWRRTLAGMPPQLALPFDFPRPERDDGRGDAVDFQWQGEQWQALQAFAKDQGASLFMVLLAAFGLVLHRETRSEDLVIGTDVANRDTPDTEALIGFFVNLVALRLKPQPDTSFAGYLQQVRQVCLEAFSHQDVPFDRVVETMGQPRQGNVHPLLQALLVMQNTPGQQQRLPDIEVTPRANPQHHSKFDMALFASEEEAGLQLRWVYRPSLFRRATIERLRDGLCDILAQALAAPDTSLTDFDLHARGKASMTSSTQKQRKLSKLGKLKRQPPAADRAPVDCRPLNSGQPFPLLVESREADLDPHAWASANRAQVEQWLGEHGGILFRGFQLPTPVDFEGFCQALHPELYGQYGDLPKKDVGQKIYRSTPYPNDRMILFHNESAHQHRWPRRQWFYCEVPAPVGGATPIVDCRQVYRALPGWLRDKLQDKQLLYIRNFTGQIDVTWQHFFRTERRDEVEAICREGGIQFEWGEGDTLHTRQRGPAVIRHPATGELSFFNQIQLYHMAFLEEDVRAQLLDGGGEERLPRHVCYGDGEPLEDEAIQLISAAYEDHAVRFDWQAGDVVMLDNMLAAHARDPFEGERRIAVAMGDIYRRDQVAAPRATDEPSATHVIEEPQT
ncbi:amino acid adenylation domain-containing protein [Marinobacter sp. DUT-3]|uniref:non-ribosomal peptide synthetase n=1 Tax=Marinobacter sp. DUT-3 TaxID=3412036 RepID=UPI003D173A9A